MAGEKFLIFDSGILKERPYKVSTKSKIWAQSDNFLLTYEVYTDSMVIEQWAKWPFPSTVQYGSDDFINSSINIGLSMPKERASFILSIHIFVDFA
jgi:hypothetical protein